MTAPTIREVAARAGVSTSTVSNVLNGYRHIRPSTRERVLRAVEALGYRPNAAGRVLRSGTSRLVALALPDLRIPYFAELAHHLAEEGRRRGYGLLTVETGADPQRELAAAGGYEEADAAAVVLFAFGVSSEEVADRRPSIPVVVLGRDVAPSWTDHFLLDIGPSADAVVEHLVRAGRRRVAYAGWLLDQPTAIAGRQAEAVGEALRARGLELHPALRLGLGGHGREAGLEAALRLIGAPVAVDAVVAASAPIAVGVCQGLAEAGVRVPDDVAVACWGGGSYCEDVRPALTAVHPRHDLMAVELWDLLERRLRDGVAETGESRLAQWDLQVRESTAGASVPASGTIQTV